MAVVQDGSEALAPSPAAQQSPTAQETPLVHADFMTVTAFPSWEAFNIAFEEYQRDTYQVFVGKTSTSVATRNDRVMKQLQTTRPDLRNYDSRLIPEEFKVYTRTLVCTHAGKRRSQSRGLRPKQKTRAMECPAKISALAQRKSDDSGWHIVVRTQITSHNHPLDAESFVMHPRNRKVQNPMVLEAVNALRKAGVKRQKIQTYIAEKEPSKHVTRSDVNNLLNRMKNDTEFLMNAFASQQPTPPISPQVRLTQPPVQPIQPPTTQVRLTQPQVQPIQPPTTPVQPTQPPITSVQHAQPPITQVQSAVIDIQPTQPHSSQVEHTQRPSNQVVFTEPRVTQVAWADTIDEGQTGNEQAPIASSGTLRGDGNGERGLSTNQPATQPMIQPTTEPTDQLTTQPTTQPTIEPTTEPTNQSTTQQNSESDANSLHRLRETTHVASGVFKLRVKRLEEQNLALFKQNNKLILQNRQYVADLNQASKKSAEKDARMMALQRSHASLKATLRALTQEMASLKEENTRLLDQRQSGDLCAATETEDEQLETEEPAKRSLPVDTTASDGAIEFVIRPQKRSK